MTSLSEKPCEQKIQYLLISADASARENARSVEFHLLIESRRGQLRKASCVNHTLDFSLVRTHPPISISINNDNFQEIHDSKRGKFPSFLLNYFF